MADEKKNGFIIDAAIGGINLEPDSKLKWYVRAIAGKPQQIGLGVLFLLIVITVWYFRTFGLAGLLKNYDRWHTGNNEPLSSRQASVPTITITKGVWSEKVDSSGRSLDELNITPPVRRAVMVNGDPNRIYHLTAQNDTTNLGNDVKSWQWMIEPDESVSVATVEYRLSR
jgi:hypothetical protein